MEIGVEVLPAPKGRFLRKISDLISRVDFISIPDSPFGKPVPSPLALAIMLRFLGVKVIPNYRVADRNEVALLSEIIGLVELGVDRVLIVGGDPSSIGRPTGLDSVKAISLIKEWGIPVKVGVVTSLRPNERLRMKLEAGADFVVTQPIQRIEELEEVKSLIGDVPLYTMILLGLGELDESVLKAMEIDRVLEVDYSELLRDLKTSGIVQGVIISSPKRTSRILKLLGE